jgi:integrase
MVPLSDMAVKLVEEAIAKTARDGFLFPSPTGNASIGSRALSKAFLRNAAELGIPEPPKPGKGQKVDPALKTARRRERRAMAFAPHDLRRSAASRMAELGFTRFAVGRILNHTEAGVGRVYDRYEYLKEKRAALDAWARQLDIILSGKKAKGAEVVALRRG